MFLLVMFLFSYVGSHLINSLILLENIVLLIYFMLVLLSASGGICVLQVLVLFVLSVSRARLGLSVLVTLARSHGNDLFKSYSLL
jgi:NADH-ubiquinone oxidoreductase chain 4L